ncbi:MAG: hypothetical protein IH987_02715 [Planctomycetes bacterium]|nr:hypothetical protein [Planctomycetota bacterium]
MHFFSISSGLVSNPAARIEPRRRWIPCAFAAALLPGCAIHYFDPATGTEHLWGIGHLKMKIISPTEGVRATVRGSQTIGASFGSLEEQSYVTLGYQRRERLDVLDEDTVVRLEWPSSDFFEVRVGSEFPKEFIQEEKLANDDASNGDETKEPNQ